MGLFGGEANRVDAPMCGVCVYVVYTLQVHCSLHVHSACAVAQLQTDGGQENKPESKDMKWEDRGL
jgi:hypothetical protein